MLLKSKKLQDGYISFILIGIAFFAFLMVTGFINDVNPPNDGTRYVVTTPELDSSHKTLQFNTFKFVKIPPSSSPNLSPSPTPFLACANSIPCKCIPTLATIVSCQLYTDCPTTTFFRTNYPNTSFGGVGCVFVDTSGPVIYINDLACSLTCP